MNLIAEISVCFTLKKVQLKRLHYGEFCVFLFQKRFVLIGENFWLFYWKKVQLKRLYYGEFYAFNLKTKDQLFKWYLRWSRLKSKAEFLRQLVHVQVHSKNKALHHWFTWEMFIQWSVIMVFCVCNQSFQWILLRIKIKAFRWEETTKACNWILFQMESTE